MNCRMIRLLAKIRLKNRQKYKANGKGGDKRQELKKKKGDRLQDAETGLSSEERKQICPKKGSRVMSAKYDFILFLFLKRAIK